MAETGGSYTTVRAILLQRAEKAHQQELPSQGTPPLELLLPLSSQKVPPLEQAADLAAAIAEGSTKVPPLKRSDEMAAAIAEGSTKVPPCDRAKPRVYAWEINEATFCELKLALDELKGDIRTPERERGRRVRGALNSAIDELPLQRVDDFEEMERRHDKGGIAVLSKFRLQSAEHGLEGVAQLVIWSDELELFQLKTLRPTETPPRVPFRRLNTGAFESDAAQALSYGLLLEQKFGIVPRLWIIYAHEKFVEDVTAMTSSPQSDALRLLQTLRAASPIEVPFTARNREYIVGALERIRRIKISPEDVRRSHSSVGRCNGCAHRQNCPDRLI